MFRGGGIGQTRPALNERRHGLRFGYASQHAREDMILLVPIEEAMLQDCENVQRDHEEQCVRQKSMQQLKQPRNTEVVGQSIQPFRVAVAETRDQTVDFP